MKTFTQYIIEARKPKPIGKDISGTIYVHRQYADNHPLIPQEHLDNAREVLKNKHPNHNYNIVKYCHTGPEAGSVSFLRSDDFDTAPEPIVGDSVKVKPNGSTSVTKKTNPPKIYHHKHEFVGSDYKGFDPEESKARSKAWKPVIDAIKAGTHPHAPHDPKIMKRIGNKNVWDRDVVPYINK